jgi:MtN3 and saliva related transmembrane protein|tara:strand:- start:339 stop:596 length:258 start_codon:yes stop_codon:yes gene_type:complete
MNIEIIGFIAAAITTSAYMPQAYKIWKTKKAESVSLSMYLVMFLGISLWLIYGIVINKPSLIIANTLTLLIILMILYFKITSKNN